MITEETITRMKQNLEVKNEFFVLDFIKHLETQIEEQEKLIETQYAENQTLGNNNAKLLHLYGECKKKNEELKLFCTKLIKANNELRKSLRKYEIVPDVDYLPNGFEVYKENVGNNPYNTK